jgi:hypothetical protein
MHLRLSRRKEPTNWWTLGPVGDGMEADQVEAEAGMEVDQAEAGARVEVDQVEAEAGAEADHEETSQGVRKLRQRSWARRRPPSPKL